MPRGTVVFWCVAAGLVVGEYGFRPSAPLILSRVDAAVDDPLPDIVEPKNPPRLIPDRSYFGAVAGIGADWVDLGPGWEGSHSKDEPKLKDDATKPLRLRAAGAVIAGDIRGLGYRLADLTVGDVVFIRSGVTPKGEAYCLEIEIRRRPKGKIPPVPGMPFPESGTHLRHQAEQDWEEKGTPIPRLYLAPNGRAWWTNPPYPPVAPLPRPGTPRADASAPREAGPPPIPPARP